MISLGLKNKDLSFRRLDRQGDKLGYACHKRGQGSRRSLDKEIG